MHTQMINMRTAGIVRVGSAAWLILTIKSRESVISVAGVCGTFHPELPSLLALVDCGLDVIEPVPDPLLQSQVQPALAPLADGDSEVAPLVQQRHCLDVGQLHLKHHVNRPISFILLRNIDNFAALFFQPIRLLDLSSNPIRDEQQQG